MKTAKYYNVADHRFCVRGDETLSSLMTNYQPFACADGDALFTLDIDSGDAPHYTEELRQDDEGQTIVCGHTDTGQVVFQFGWFGANAGWLVCKADYSEGLLITTAHHAKMAIDNALMIMFALATADKRTALFHAAVVSYQDKGYMFLGPSGTGKSTHARLWLQYISGTELVNDDNPVVRIGADGTAEVFGSAWSGKTPCYRNVRYHLGGIVLLSQAPYNKIQPLGALQAYAALVTSISGKRWDARIADGLHATENALAMQVPVWHLECLPDEAAARLCNKYIKH